MDEGPFLVADRDRGAGFEIGAGGAGSPRRSIGSRRPWCDPNGVGGGRTVNLPILQLPVLLKEGVVSGSSAATRSTHGRPGNRWCRRSMHCSVSSRLRRGMCAVLSAAFRDQSSATDCKWIRAVCVLDPIRGRWVALGGMIQGWIIRSQLPGLASRSCKSAPGVRLHLPGPFSGYTPQLKALTYESGQGRIPTGEATLEAKCFEPVAIGKGHRRVICTAGSSVV